ncbi:hypothetical protein [Brevibacterium album]|uniref:hypothetical protein n=1 Tax=Brevibacterium album TaxID=417948 RepID=UPI0003FE39D3|nr:hypothetical protein [Brevibacterium album]
MSEQTDLPATEEPLATVDQVAARCGEPIELADEIALAESMIEAASAQVRHYGRLWPVASKAPAIARTIATSAAARGYMNPSGYTDERSDSVSLKRADMYAADVQLTPNEIRMLREASGAGSVQSIRIELGAERFIPRSQQRSAPLVRRDPHEGAPLADGVHTPIPFFREGR